MSLTLIIAGAVGIGAAGFAACRCLPDRLHAHTIDERTAE